MTYVHPHTTLFQEGVPASCVECPHLPTCSSLSAHPYNQVHSCVMCFKKVMSDLSGGEEEVRFVPGDCPRWDPVFASARACKNCYDERDRLRRLNPHFQRRLQSVGVMISGMVEAIRKPSLGENVVNLGDVRERQEAIQTYCRGGLDELVEAVQAGDSSTIHGWESASELTLLLLGSISSDPEFQYCIGCGTWDWEVIKARLLEEFKYTLDRESDPEAICHEWKFHFTDAAVGSRTWRSWPIPKRKMMLNTWTVIITRFLDERQGTEKR